jgi:carnitine O-acetyltransferase
VSRHQNIFRQGGYLDTLQSYLLEVQRILVQLYLSANKRPAPFVDHSGILRDSKTGLPINGQSSSDDVMSEGYEDMMSQSRLLISKPIS